MRLPWFPPDLLLLPALGPTERPHLEEISLSSRLGGCLPAAHCPKTAFFSFWESTDLQSLLKCRLPNVFSPALSFFKVMVWWNLWQPTPVSLPGESYGQRSLVGYSPWGHKDLDMTEATQHAHMSFYYWVRRVSYVFFICTSSLSDMVCKYFVLLCAVSFHVFGSVIWNTQVFYFDEV